MLRMLVSERPVRQQSNLFSRRSFHSARIVCVSLCWLLAFHLSRVSSAISAHPALQGKGVLEYCFNSVNTFSVSERPVRQQSYVFSRRSFHSVRIVFVVHGCKGTKVQV